MQCGANLAGDPAAPGEGGDGCVGGPGEGGAANIGGKEDAGSKLEAGVGTGTEAGVEAKGFSELEVR